MPAAAASPASRFLALPASRVGRLAAAFEVLFALLFALNVVLFAPAVVPPPGSEILLPAMAVAMVGAGIAAGVASLLAVIRHRERSWLLWLALLPATLLLVFLVGELVAPH
jgi:heme/copper-type cytochrome/quinol oxidase subunit 3